MPKTETVLRINFINPGIELEMPSGPRSTISIGTGVGYGGGYPDLTSGGSGFIYIIAPFLDLQHKWYYNLKKRKTKGKSTANNSGNFFSIRALIRGPSLSSNVTRTSNLDTAIGPTWGLQRKLGENLHLLFDLGPQYYFDRYGNGGFWPLTVQINLGLDLGKSTAKTNMDAH